MKPYVFPPGSTLKGGAYLVLVTIDEVTLAGRLCPFGVAPATRRR